VTHRSAPKRFDRSRQIIIEDRCALSILERIVREIEPYLERAAAYMARDFPAAATDMVQEARITLWQVDLGSFAQGDAGYLQRALYTRMIDVYRSECRGGLTTGWSRGAERRKREPLVAIRKAA